MNLLLSNDFVIFPNRALLYTEKIGSHSATCELLELSSLILKHYFQYQADESGPASSDPEKPSTPCLMSHSPFSNGDSDLSCGTTPSLLLYSENITRANSVNASTYRNCDMLDG